ncbi:hypothetical protein M9Y10_032934 [Tritrichomonas musculus]|uniref:Surface antigen BspA-like n=1 Tax=Tritrichomonas musculus TaxID=1915356 RepID=A0ABR2GZT6_9EUKA
MEVSIPTSVTKIEDSAFTLCESLKKLVILSPETFVEKGVFKGCPSISEVSIPSTLNPSEIGIGVEYHIIKIGM